MTRENLLQAVPERSDAHSFFIQAVPRRSLGEKASLRGITVGDGVPKLGLTGVAEDIPTESELVLSPFNQIHYVLFRALIYQVRLGQDSQGSDPIRINFFRLLEYLLGRDIDVRRHNG